MDPIWNLVHRERAALVADLQDLSVADWQRDSACPGWTVRDVAAHLLDSAVTTPMSFVGGMVRARFDFDRQNQAGVDASRGLGTDELVQRLESVIERTSGPPTLLAPLGSRIVEEVAHGEDIRRPLGIPHDYAVDAVTTAIDYQVSTSEKFGGAKETASRVRLVADDTDWETGTGPVVSGPALEILMLVSGRTPREGAVSGPGVGEF